MKSIASIFVGIAFSGLLLAPSVVWGQGTLGGGSGSTFGGGSGSTLGGGGGSTLGGCNTVASDGTFTLCDPLGVKNFCDLVRSLLNVVLAIGLPVAVFFFVWSGFKFILARGAPDKLKVARENFFFVIVGIAVFLGAWTLATIIATTIQTLDTSGTIQFCGRT